MFTGTLQAQSLRARSTRDSMLHYYALDAQQLHFIYTKGTVPDTSYLFQNFYKASPARITAVPDSFAFGCYLEANISNNKVEYNILSRVPFTIVFKKIGQDDVMYLHDNTTRTKDMISDASILYQGTVAQYDEGYGGYVLPKTRIATRKKPISQNYLLITYKDKPYLYKAFVSVPSPSYGGGGNYAQPHLYGYFISDKPKYKPLDTLRLKAYLLFSTGKAVTEACVLELTDASNGKRVFKRVIKSSSKGAFVYDYVLPDSLKTDRDYELRIGPASMASRYHRTISFKLEDYKLDNSKLSVELSKTNLFAGDTLALIVNMSDANGFPLQGVRLQYKVSILNVSALHKDSLLLSNTQHDKWIAIDTILPYASQHVFFIKPSDLPPITANYTIEASLTDAQFEQKKFPLSFLYDAVPHRSFIFQNKDSLRVRHTYKGRDTIEKFTLKYYDEQGKMCDSLVIRTPYNAKLQAHYRTAQLFISTTREGKTRDSLYLTAPISFNALSILQTTGEKNSKVFKASFKYPFAQKVHYKVYKGTTLIASGADTALAFETADTTLSSYKILISNNFNGKLEDNMHWVYFYPLHKKLSVSSNLPEQAFPGQYLDVEFSVSDFYGKPAKNINLAAYAINAMFASSISEPYLDVPAQYTTATKTVTVSGAHPYFSAVALSAQGNHYLKKQHVPRFNLYKNEYYQLLLAPQGLAQVRSTKQQPNAEVAVFMCRNACAYLPKYVKVDGEFMQLTNVSNPHQSSFFVSPGKHTFQVRVFDRLLQINNVQVDSFSKLQLCINLDSVEAGVTKNIIQIGDTMSRTMPSEAERQAIENSLLLLSNILIDSVLTINNTALTARQFRQYSNVMSTVLVDGDAFNAILPYNAKPVQLFHKHNRHTLYTGRHFYYFDIVSNAFVQKSLSKSAPFVFNFIEQAASAEDIAYYLEPDTIVVKQEATQVGMTTNTRFSPKYFDGNSFQYYPYVYTANTATVKVLGSAKAQATHLWLVSKTQKARSLFTHLSNGSIVNCSITSNNMDVYLFYTDNTFTFLPNMNIPALSTLYLCTDSLPKSIISEEALAPALDVYNAITATPMMPFYGAPQESNKLELKATTIDNSNGNMYFRGIVTGEGVKSVAYADLIIEKQGRYVAGATTNVKGEFEFLGLPAGVYEVKVFALGYQYKYYYNASLIGTKGLSTVISLQDRQTGAPKYEALNNNFSYAAYPIVSDSQKYIRVHVYSASTRQPITANSISLRAPDGITATCTPRSNVCTFMNITGSGNNLEVKANKYNTCTLEGLFSTDVLRQEIYVYLNDSVGDADFYRLRVSTFTEVDRHRFDYRTNESLEEISVTARKHAPFMSVANPGEPPVITAAQVEKLASRNTSDAVSLRAGVYQARNAAGINMGGGRSGGTRYMIDGMMVTGSTALAYGSVEAIQVNVGGLPASLGGGDGGFVRYTGYGGGGGAGYSYYGKAKAPRKKEDAMWDDMLNGDEAQQYRENFKDNAYWLANYTTDKNGKAYAHIKLPDNITEWQAFNLAMGEQFYYGQSSQKLRVYKPLQTISFMPECLHQGDSIRITARFTNLTSEAKRITTFFEQNASSLKSNDVLVTDNNTDSVLVIAETLDTLLLTAGLRFQDKYTDAERKKIPVFDNILHHYYYQSIMMDYDSTYNIRFGNGSITTLTFNNNLYERILQYTSELSNYSYGCVEQTSSKLKALLFQQEINAKLGRKVVRDVEIMRLIERLEDMQNSNGTFGWWRKGSADMRMTSYAFEALLLAQKKGYTCHGAADAATALEKNLPMMPTNEKLVTLYTLASNGFISLNRSQLMGINPVNLSAHDKLYYYKLSMMLGDKVSDNDIYNMCLEINNAARTCGYGNFFEDERALMFKAIQLYKGTSVGRQMQDMFGYQILNGSLDKNLNTFSKATLIEALMLQEEAKGKSIGSTLVINDTIKVNAFPYTLKTRAAQVRIAHTGSNVFLQTAEQHNVYMPQKVDSVFGINTSFLVNGNTVNKLQRGTNTTLRINMSAYKTKEHVMIEIPLPAGIRITNKNAIQLSGEDYIEYHKDKIIIFKSKLAQGDAAIDIPVQVVFAGKFNMPAAQASLMYYPFINGNNTDKVVEIE
jgi:hypothetical protein